MLGGVMEGFFGVIPMMVVLYARAHAYGFCNSWSFLRLISSSGFLLLCWL